MITLFPSKEPRDATESTQRYLPIAEIHDDTVVLNDGGLRAVLSIGTVNINLKSEEEQNAIIASYQGFLNSLEFPIQILIRSAKLDIDRYLDNLQKTAENQKNPLLQRQTFDYLTYMRRLIEYADIMEKKFYVVVPYDSSAKPTKENVFKQFWRSINPEDSVAKFAARRKEFETDRKGLMQRVTQVKAGLDNMNLPQRQLTTKELIELFYLVYNPVTGRNQKLDDTPKAED